MVKPPLLIHRVLMFWVKFPRITLCKEILSRMIDTSNTKQLAQNQINISSNTAKYFTPPKACFEIKQLRSLLYGGFCFLCTLRHTRYICYSTTLESAVNHLERDGCKGLVHWTLRQTTSRMNISAQFNFLIGSVVSLIQKKLGSCCRLW